jgi:phosphoribosyl 1,2-cyclic phosphodiesterase
MKLWMLGSGSSGNAVLLECDGSRILIDAGFGVRTLAKRLKVIDVDPRSIEACLITHEHSDHVSGAAAAARRWGWTLYATHATARTRVLKRAAVKKFTPGTTLEFPRFTVETTKVPHDAPETVGFVATSRSTGARAALFYDLGRVTASVARLCQDIDILVLESNHDEDMLHNGSYPPWLKKRIASPVGHLSNKDAGLFARVTVRRTLSHLVLAHLSEQNNRPDVALNAMRAALAKTTFKGKLTAAKQDVVVGPFTPSGAKAEKPTQYSLF